MNIKEMKELVKDVDKGKIKTLNLQDEFQFKCTACGRCCFNNSILLNIYDIIRLRNSTKLPTQELVKRNFIEFYIGPSSGLPVCTLHFSQISKSANRCPFLAPAIHYKDMIEHLKVKGITSKEEMIKAIGKNPDEFHKKMEGAKIDRWLCGVHKDRPMVCRLFPLGRIKVMDKKLKTQEEKIIIQNATDWCSGWKTKEKITLKHYLEGCEYWHFKEGSDKSYGIMNLMAISGFFAYTKHNKDKKALFDEKSPILVFAGNLLYNFDSFNFCSKDQRVAKTIYDKEATQEDFIYVLDKVENAVRELLRLFKEKQPNPQQFLDFIKYLTEKGGEKNA